MLFTLPGSHAVEDLDARFHLIVSYLARRDVNGLRNCRIGYSLHTGRGLSRVEYLQSSVTHEDFDAFINGFIDKLEADGTEELVDLQMFMDPHRNGVLQTAELILEKETTRDGRPIKNSFSVHFKDHPNADKLTMADALLRGALGNAL